MLRVAFASNDRSTVNQHFGATEGFAIYGLDADGKRPLLLEVIEFDAAAMDGVEDKLGPRIDALAGCAAVYCRAIGGSAVRQLLARGVQPVRLDDAESIESVLAQLQAAAGDGSVPWLERARRKAAGSDADDRFARMAEEGWQE